MEIQTVLQVTYARLDGDTNNITINISQTRWRYKQYYKWHMPD